MGENAIRRRLPWALAAVASAAACAASAATPFTVVLIPDTQNYTKTEANNNKYFKGQTRWIRDNMDALNIAFVMHLGDIQQSGNPYYANGKPTPWLDGDESEWIRADAALDILDNNHVPYSLVPGNHDYLKYDAKEEPGYYLKWFGPQRFEGKPTFGGASPKTPTSPAGMNTYHLFEAGGYKFLNLALQYHPDKYDLTWAQQVINANPGVPTIVTTHAYIGNDGYNLRYLFDDFVKLNPQIVLTANGHIINGNNVLSDTNVAGQTVHQMLIDYQGDDFPGLFQGGGYLRTLQFDTDANLIRVKSYSPIADDYLTDKKSQFTLSLNLAERFGLPNDGGIKKSVAFRQGAAGYTGTRDTYLDATEPTATHGSESTGWVDGDRDGAASGKQPAHALLRFDFIFDAGGIPDGAVIDSATLTVHTSNIADSQSNSTVALYRVLKPWTVNGTWDSQGDGISVDATDALYAPDDAFAAPTRDRYVTFDVTEALSAWAAGAPNYGWALLADGSDGWRWDTSEATDPLDRPVLNVSYRVVPEPCTWGFMMLAGVLPLPRRK